MRRYACSHPGTGGPARIERGTRPPSGRRLCGGTRRRRSAAASGGQPRELLVSRTREATVHRQLIRVERVDLGDREEEQARYRWASRLYMRPYLRCEFFRASGKSRARRSSATGATIRFRPSVRLHRRLLGVDLKQVDHGLLDGRAPSCCRTGSDTSCRSSLEEHPGEDLEPSVSPVRDRERSPAWCSTALQRFGHDSSPSAGISA